MVAQLCRNFLHWVRRHCLARRGHKLPIKRANIYSDGQGEYFHHCRTLQGFVSNLGNACHSEEVEGHVKFPIWNLIRATKMSTVAGNVLFFSRCAILG